MPIEKCVLPLGQPSGNNITHTERSWCQGQLSCKDVGDGRHVLIFHFVGVSEHVAAGRGCNEADRRREAAPPARHPPAEEPPDTSRTINGRRTRKMPSTWPVSGPPALQTVTIPPEKAERELGRRSCRGNLQASPATGKAKAANGDRPKSCSGSCTAH